MKDGFYQHQDILEALRTRICLTPPTDSFPLGEGLVAKEFNVSRTPVRQVLQTLAREHLVEIRPSVGASVVRLTPESRAQSFEVYRDLTAIAAKLAEGRPLPTAVGMEFAGIWGILSSGPEQSTDLYVSLMVRIQAALSLAVEDQIVLDAMLAAFWRMIRWRVQDIACDPNLHWERFRHNVQLANEATRMGDPSHMLRTIAGLSDRMVADSRK